MGSLKLTGSPLVAGRRMLLGALAAMAWVPVSGYASESDSVTAETRTEQQAPVPMTAPGEVSEAVTAPPAYVATPAAPEPQTAAVRAEDEPSLVERYRRGNSHATQMAFSPTAILLPDGISRFSSTEVLLLQYNAGVGDRVQIGFNTTWLVTVGGDIKIRLGDIRSPHQFALLAGLGLQTIDYRNAAYYIRPAYSYLFEYADGRVGLLNVSLTYGAAGRWTPEIMEAMPDCPVGVKCRSTRSTTVELFQSENMFSGLTLGAHLPWRQSHWSWVFEGAVGAQPLDRIDRETYVAAAFAGLRKRADNWAFQFGLLRPFMRSMREDYFMGYPFLDFSWTFE